MLSFSAIVVNYNGIEDTLSCVRSLNKSFECLEKKLSLEIVIVNNSNEKFNINEFKNVLLIETGYNVGLSPAWYLGFYNKAVQNSSYVILINNDVIVKEDFFKKLIEGIYKWGENCSFGPRIYSLREPNLIWSYGGSLNKWLGSIKHNTNIEKKSLPNKRKDFETSHLSGCCFVISKDDFNQIGGPNIDYFFRGEEWDLNYRLKKRGKKLILLDELEIYHKINASHERYNPKMLYYAYAAKAVFAKSIMPNWYFYIWFVLAIISSFTFLHAKFAKESKYSKKLIRKAMVKGLINGWKDKKVKKINFDFN